MRAGSGECDPFGRKAQVNNAVLAGRRPNLTTLPAGLPPALLALLASCWAAAPGDRPRSGGELLEALREAAPNAGPPPLPPILAQTFAQSTTATALTAPAEAVVGPLGRAPEVAAWRPGLMVAQCPVCSEEGQPGVALGCGFPGGHTLCNSCALRVVRSELVPGAAMVRCPLCRSQRPPVDAPVSEQAVAEVAAWSRQPGRAGAVGDMRPLSADEHARFAQVEADRRRRQEEEARLAAEVCARDLE